VLVRNHEIPDQALGKLRQILTLELESVTPFSVDEASFDFIVARNSTSGRRRVRQIIVKNSIIDDVVGDLRRQRLDVHAIDAEGAEGVNLLPERLRKRARPQSRKNIALLFASFAAAYMACYYRQVGLINELANQQSQLEGETSAVREAAAAAVAAAANIQALRKHQVEYPLALSTLASLTRVLDDSVWLTELSIAGRDITLSGYAASAADAISALEASNEFEGASFTTAVITDQPTNAERFSARLRVAGGELEDVGKGKSGL
jgi:general secretion pathway protein L